MVNRGERDNPGYGYGITELEDAFNAMLKKSNVALEYKPILFESFLSLFKLDSSTHLSDMSPVIHSPDNSTFCFSTGTLKLSRKRAFRGLYRSTLFILIMTMATFLPKSKKNLAGSALLFGFEDRLIESDEAVRNLIQSLKKTFPQLLSDKREFLFESRRKGWFKPLSSKGNTYPYAALRVLRDEIPLKSRLVVLFSILKLASKMMGKNWNLFLLAPERAHLEFPLWRSLLTDSDFCLIATQSKLELLPIPFYVQSENRLMIWYSNNSLPFDKTGCKSLTPSIATNSNFIDHHYVWSESHKTFLKYRYPNAEITVVGPILFEPEVDDALMQIQPEGILFFDVTPFENLGFETFYTPRMCSESVEDLSQVAQELGCRLRLKPKRSYLRSKKNQFQHSASYLKQLDQLEFEDLIIRLEPTALITESILNCQVVVGLPFTSPVLVASHLNRPCIYYVPLETEDWDIPNERDGIPVLRGKKQLLDYLSGIIDNKSVSQ
jgi:hypothetical protein